MDESILVLIPVTAIIGAFTYVIIHTLAKGRVRELEVRERIAMIERGLVPPPEVDPRGFDRAMGRHARTHDWSWGSGRHRRAAITMLGVGFGLMVLTGNPRVGGFLVILGIAFFVNSLFEGRESRSDFPSGNAGGTAQGSARPTDTLPPS